MPVFLDLEFAMTELNQIRVPLRTCCTTVIVLVGLLSMSTSSLADDATADVRAEADGNEEAGKFLLREMWSARERLVSGRCIATESVSIDGAPDRRVSVADIMFDDEQQRLRFEYRNELDPHLSFLYVSTAQGTTIHQQELAKLPARELGDVSRRSRPRGFFDPRNLGIVTHTELDRRTFREVRDVLSDGYSVLGAMADEDPMGAKLTLTQLNGRGNAFREITLDSKHGLVPARMEVCWMNNETGKWTAPRHMAETEWKSVSDICVPVKCVMRKLWGDERRITLEIEWVEVNAQKAPESSHSKPLEVPE